jgi:hypothetical protein
MGFWYWFRRGYCRWRRFRDIFIYLQLLDEKLRDSRRSMCHRRRQRALLRLGCRSAPPRGHAVPYVIVVGALSCRYPPCRADQAVNAFGRGLPPSEAASRRLWKNGRSACRTAFFEAGADASPSGAAHGSLERLAAKGGSVRLYAVPDAVLPHCREVGGPLMAGRRVTGCFNRHGLCGLVTA